MDDETKRLSSLEERVGMIEERLEQLGEVDAELEGFADVARLSATISKLDALVRGDPDSGVIGLDTIVNGSERLNVEPIRATLHRVATTHDRLVWLAGFLGITTVASLITWLFVIFSGSVP